MIERRIGRWVRNFAHGVCLMRGSGTTPATAGKPGRIAPAQRHHGGPAGKDEVRARAMQRSQRRHPVGATGLKIRVGYIRLSIVVTRIHVAACGSLDLPSSCGPGCRKSDANNHGIYFRDRVDNQSVERARHRLDSVIGDPVSQVLDPRDDLRMVWRIARVHVSRAFDGGDANIGGHAGN